MLFYHSLVYATNWSLSVCEPVAGDDTATRVQCIAPQMLEFTLALTLSSPSAAILVTVILDTDLFSLMPAVT